MRILGFSKRWQKLSNSEFTTFRFARRDRDWQVGEVVRVVFRPRSKHSEVLGIAKVVAKEPRDVNGDKLIFPPVTEAEAQADGFPNTKDMKAWIEKVHGRERLLSEPMNKLRVRWIKADCVLAEVL